MVMKSGVDEPAHSESTATPAFTVIKLPLVLHDPPCMVATVAPNETSMEACPSQNRCVTPSLPALRPVQAVVAGGVDGSGATVVVVATGWPAAAASAVPGEECEQAPTAAAITTHNATDRTRSPTVGKLPA